MISKLIFTVKRAESLPRKYLFFFLGRFDLCCEEGFSVEMLIKAFDIGIKYFIRIFES